MLERDKEFSKAIDEIAKGISESLKVKLKASRSPKTRNTSKDK